MQQLISVKLCGTGEPFSQKLKKIQSKHCVKPVHLWPQVNGTPDCRAPHALFMHSSVVQVPPDTLIIHPAGKSGRKGGGGNYSKPWRTQTAMP
jgi:hypothetical protein